MTAVYDTLSATVERLVEACHSSELGFKAATQAVQAEQLKRLLNLYSLQRARFAAELKSQCPMQVQTYSCSIENYAQEFAGKPDGQILELCLTVDGYCLQGYSEALALRVPGRAQFLIAAQYSLMQQVHTRMRALVARTDDLKVTKMSLSL